MKCCSKCNEIKEFSEFSKDSRSKERGGDGLQSKCKDCNRAYRKSNKDAIKEYRQKYYQENKHEIKAKSKAYYNSNLNSCIESRRDYYKINKSKWLAYGRKSRKNMSPLDKFKVNIRSRVNKSINRKSNSTEDILGCGIDFFVDYLGYCGDNNMELDHIVPCSFAKSKEEAVALNHYSNFNLVSRKYNRKKGNRFILLHNFEKVLLNHNNPQIINDIINNSKVEIKL